VSREKRRTVGVGVWEMHKRGWVRGSEAAKRRSSEAKADDDDEADVREEARGCKNACGRCVDEMRGVSYVGSSCVG
jgi:hypothetical protein